jgi:hypothetical protein
MVKSLFNNLIPDKIRNSILWGCVLLNLVTSFLLIKSVINHWNAVRTEIRDYALSFDKIEPKLIEASGKEISIHNIKPVGELDSFTDNKGWVAGCLTGYYKLKSIKID